jgi:hypothetical protein
MTAIAVFRYMTFRSWSILFARTSQGVKTELIEMSPRAGIMLVGVGLLRAA